MALVAEGAPDGGRGGAGAKHGGARQRCSMQRARYGLVTSGGVDLSSEGEEWTKMTLDVGMEGRGQIATCGEQRVRTKGWWKGELERRVAARLGRALTAGWSVTSGRHLRDSASAWDVP